MKKIFIIFGIILVVVVGTWLVLGWVGGGLTGGGGSEQITPDTTKSGQSNIIKFIVNAWGGGGPIKGRFTDIALHYRLVGQTNYEIIQPKLIALPENFQKAVTKTLQYEAYEFIIPPYPQGTTGSIEYYIELKFDGYFSKTEGIKKIKIE